MKLCGSMSSTFDRDNGRTVKGYLFLIGVLYYNILPVDAAKASTVYLHPAEYGGTYENPIKNDIRVFKWLLVENNVGDYSGTMANPPTGCDPFDATYPEACDWPSVRSIKATAPIYTSGDHTEWNHDIPFKFPRKDHGKFMVTVMADGYRTCGGYFETLDEQFPVDIHVNLACQKHVIPLGTIRMFVFLDNNPCNGQYDPGELPLADFGIGINDIEGPITEDYYGNSNLDIVSDENGMIEVPNMWPNRYDLDCAPPPGEGWIKTNTLEGGHGWDYWLYEKWDGYDNEFLIGAEQFPMAVAGYTKIFDDLPKPDEVVTGSLITLTGKVQALSVWPNGLNFAEVNGVTPGLNAKVKGPLFNQDGIIAISDLMDGDKTVYVGETNADGTFELQVLKEREYMITYFDITQAYILQFKTFITESGPYDLQELGLTGWFTEVEGFFFEDTNGNGIRDPGEEGLSSGPFPVFRYRDGSQVDRGFQFLVPFADPIRKGFYKLSHGYPFSSWITMHVYHPLWEMTGYSYRIANQPADATTTVRAMKDEYDIALFGTPSVTTYLDVGFRRKSSTKGSIYGAVHYDTVRANMDADQAVVENHEPGIPGIPVSIYRLDIPTVQVYDCKTSCQKRKMGFGYDCPGAGTKRTKKTQEAIECTQFWVGKEEETSPHPITFWTSTNNVTGDIKVLEGQVVFRIGANAKDKAITKTSKWKPSVITSEFKTPTNCKITDHEGNAMPFGSGQSVLPDPDVKNPVPCIETPLLRNQVGGFANADGSFQFSNLEPGYYAIQVEIPNDKKGKKMYKVRSENDVNVYDSDVWEGQQTTNYPFDETNPFVPPPECPSANEECPVPIDNTPPKTPNHQNVKTPCAGGFFTVSSDGNPSFKANGGSYAEGQRRRYCDIKIVRVEGGINSKVTFNLFTDVPIPGRWKGVILDDRAPQANPKSVLYTELLGVPNMPIGVRDYTGTLLSTIQTDAQGYFEMLIPSSRNSASMHKTAAMFSGAMYCMIANDSGSSTNPSTVAPLKDYRPIKACFESMPGRITPVDLAPVSMMAPMVQNGGDIMDVMCDLPSGKPELYNVKNENFSARPSGPICKSESYPCQLIIRGKNLIINGAAPSVSLSTPNEQQTGPHIEKTPPAVSVVSYNSQSNNGIPYDKIVISIADPGTSFGMYQLELTNNAGIDWIAGISVHLLGGGYTPVILDTRDDHVSTYTPVGRVQAAIDRWESFVKGISTDPTLGNPANGAIVMAYPDNIAANNPEGAHVENLVMTIPIKIQGIGPGGPNRVDVETRGTQLNGGGFGAGVLCSPEQGLFCDAQAQTAWQANLVDKLSALDFGQMVDGRLVTGQVLYVLSTKDIYDDTDWTNEAMSGGVDGCLITEGSQAAVVNPIPAADPGVPQVVGVQGGGVTLHSYNKFFRITNNHFTGNSGSFAGAIRVGTAFLDPETGGGNSFNTELTISRNHILYNGGFNLAGGVGLFGGSDNYVVHKNYICGNNGQEYGGAVSHFGASENGLISDNWILWNRATDEGGGIAIAAETLAVVNTGGAAALWTKDAGDVEIRGNIIQGCLSGDDGGGILFLNVGLSNYKVHQNNISHNVALHVGAGVALNDAPFVNFHENIVVSNLVSGTSAESDTTKLYPVGLSAKALSPILLERMLTYTSTVSAPQNFTNNIFWDNRVSNGEVVGDGSAATPFALRGLGIDSADKWLFDMGSIGSVVGEQLTPTDSIIQTLGEYYTDNDPSVLVFDCIEKTPPYALDPFVSTVPFACAETSSLSDAAVVTSAAEWGVDLSIQVLGLTVTAGGSNTFVVSGAALEPGPIAINIDILTDVRRKLVQVDSLIAEENQGMRPSSSSSLRTTTSTKTRNVLEENPYVVFPDHNRAVKFHYVLFSNKTRAWLSLLVFFMVTVIPLLVVTSFTRASNDNPEKDESSVASTSNKRHEATNNNKHLMLRHFIFVLLGFWKGVSADPHAGCTVDCIEFGIKLPEQIKYQTEIFTPGILDLRTTSPPDVPCEVQNVDVYMKYARQDFGAQHTNGSQLLTPIYGYTFDENEDATYPGPTILVSKNCPVNITWHNKLGVGPHMFPIDPTAHCGSVAKNCVAENGAQIRTTVHLHGGHTKAIYDGHPQTWFTDYNATGMRSVGSRFSETGLDAAGVEQVFSGFSYFDNDQPACTLFYHDHALGITRLNVYAGLAGMYIIEDEEKKRVFADHGLSDAHDVPLVFADYQFAYEEHDMEAPLFYAYGVSDADGGSLPQFSILPENFGNVMVVNGRIYPFMNVEEGGLYHFRLLNNCDSRFLRLSFEYEESAGVFKLIPFTVVGSDQGILSNTDELTEIPFGPAERYEILVSFAGLAGKTVLVKNSEYTLLGPVVPGIDDQFMQIRVQSSPGVPSASLPQWTKETVPYDDIFQGLINISLPDVVNENILYDRINKKEVWITEGTQVLVDANTPGGGRPLPMLGPRQNPFGLSYEAAATEVMIQGKPIIWELINLSADAHVIHLHQVRFKILDRQAVGLSYDTFQRPGGFYRQYPKDSEDPGVYEAGPKDVFITYPGTVTRLIMYFDLSGVYVWHCHILSHEDNMMIRDLVVESPINVTAYINDSDQGTGTNRTKRNSALKKIIYLPRLK